VAWLKVDGCAAVAVNSAESGHGRQSYGDSTVILTAAVPSSALIALRIRTKIIPRNIHESGSEYNYAPSHWAIIVQGREL
jgi:hypothetical protein